MGHRDAQGDLVALSALGLLSSDLMCFLCGLEDKTSMKTDLMKVPMTIMDWEKCSKAFPKLTKNMLCAGYENESFDACQVTKGYPHPHPTGSYHLRATNARVSSLH